MPFLLNPCQKCWTRHYSDQDCPKRGRAKKGKPAARVTKSVTTVTKSVTPTARVLQSMGETVLVAAQRMADPPLLDACPHCGRAYPKSVAERKRRSRAKKRRATPSPEKGRSEP